MENRYSLDYWQNQLDPIWLEQIAMVHRGKDVQQAIKESYGHLIADEERLMKSDLSDFKKLVNTWMSTKRFPRENVIKPKRDLSKL